MKRSKNKKVIGFITIALCMVSCASKSPPASLKATSSTREIMQFFPDNRARVVRGNVAYRYQSLWQFWLKYGDQESLPYPTPESSENLQDWIIRNIPKIPKTRLEGMVVTLRADSGEEFEIFIPTIEKNNGKELTNFVLFSYAKLGGEIIEQIGFALYEEDK